jgi:hypothetical protein
MLTAEQVLDTYFLDVRCMLLEIAATLDRHDAASERAGGPAAAADGRLEKLYQSLGILADEHAGANRAEQLLNLFSDPVD